jgi:hypothetical protein
MRIVLGAVLAPILLGPFVVSMVAAMQSFQSTYSESLCRMESVRTHAIESIMSDEPITPNFGGDECLTPMLPTLALYEDAATTPTPESP